MLTRGTAEIGTAAATAALGITVMIGALEFGIGWGSSGPGAGAFPFYIGLLVTAASLVNLVQAFMGRGRLQELFFDREQALRVLGFFVPVLLFVVVSLILGIYVATALYLTLTMWLQGGYRLLVSALTGVAAAAFFFVVLEYFFQVPLLKGPLEAALGLY
jgi:Tripartite tricarboxylate transporter TctB family